jgi:hypothetical protein
MRFMSRSALAAKHHNQSLCFAGRKVSKPEKGMIDHLSPQELI